MKKPLFTIVLLFTSLIGVFATGSIYDEIHKFEDLSSGSYYLENNQQVYNTLSNDLLLSEHYLESISSRIIDSNISLYLINPDVIVSYNSRVAHSYNDGSFWQGRGLNNKVTLGFYLKSDIFTLTVLPEFWVAENKDFDIVSTTSSGGYGDYWTVFDNLQRYGGKLYTDLNLGQTDLRFIILENFTLGLSNQNINIGPGRHNNIILGSQGAGFLHTDFGTIKPIPVLNLGSYEFRTMYGLLEESDFFDNNDSNNYGWYSGVSAGFSPSLLPHLKLGFNHYYTKPFSEFEPLDLIRHIPGVDATNSAIDLKDTVVSATFDYSIPAYGFRAYGELARNDQFSTPIGLWTEPEHTMAMTLGFTQNIYTFANNNKLIFSGEITDLQQQSTLIHRFAGPWYRHSWAGWSQGYTNRGQLLGSTIGPGSNGQIAELTYVHNKGFINLIYQRIAHDKDYYYYIYKNELEEYYGDIARRSPETPVRAYTEGIIGVEALYQFTSISIFGRFEIDNHFNYNNIRVDDFTNIYIKLGVNYGF